MYTISLQLNLQRVKPISQNQKMIVYHMYDLHRDELF